MYHVHLAHGIEQLARKMKAAAHARGGVVDLALVFRVAGIGQEFGQGFGGHRWVDHHQQTVFAHQRNRREVADRVIRQRLFHHRHVGLGAVGGHQQLVTIGGHFGDGFATNAAATTGTVFNHDVLPQVAGHGLGNDAAGLVRETACGIRHDGLDGSLWVGLSLNRSQAGAGQQAAAQPSQEFAFGCRHWNNPFRLSRG